MMKIKTQWVLVGIVAACLCWIGWRGQAQSAAQDSWEYLVIPTVESAKNNRKNVDLNELGAKGWELVTSGKVDERFGDTVTGSRDYLYFKRKK
jgi:hypothetical protein